MLVPFVGGSVIKSVLTHRVASVDLHWSSTSSPGSTVTVRSSHVPDGGLVSFRIYSVTVGWAGGAVTVTSAVHCPVASPEAVTVAVYRVFAVGEAVFEPLAIGVMAPTPLSMDPLTAFALVQESTVESPREIDAGFAESVQEGVPGGSEHAGVVIVSVGDLT